MPISIVVPRGHARATAARRCLLYGYGSYETSIDPWFSIPRLSLLDRGMVFAIAHVRGGGEMGRRWYDDGKMLAKRNTFTDFVACAGTWSTTGWTSADRLVAEGGSAGGLLMGAVANLAPEAFAGIVAEVPFVDALTTILDPSLPLTVIEWEEWGNPLDDPEVYALHEVLLARTRTSTAKRYPPILADDQRSTTPACSTSSRPSGSPGCGPPPPTARRAAEDRDGGRPRRRERPVRRLAGAGVHLRLGARRAAGSTRHSGLIEQASSAIPADCPERRYRLSACRGSLKVP